MSSVIRIESNRANAAKSTGPRTPEGKDAVAANAACSTGPRTPEGKARSRRNAVKHGLLSQSVVLPDECSDLFNEALAALDAELKPRTYLQGRCLEIMAVSDWRRGRCWHMERAQLTHAVRTQEKAADPVADRENTEIASMHTALAFGSLSNQTNTLKNLQRYEVRMSREFLRYYGLFEHLSSKKHSRAKRTKAKTR